MKLLKNQKTMVILITLSLIFAFGVMTSVAQEKEIRDFFKSRVTPAPKATAETLDFKTFNHVTKSEMFPMADVEGHFIGVVVREGVIIFENGELAWHKVTQSVDLVKGAGTFQSYFTCTFLDGSTFIVLSKGSVGTTPQGVPSAAQITGNIIHGTGRFQGIKGTMTVSVKLLPPEKGELGGKALGEHTLVYTLPGK